MSRLLDWDPWWILLAVPAILSILLWLGTLGIHVENPLIPLAIYVVLLIVSLGVRKIWRGIRRQSQDKGGRP